MNHETHWPALDGLRGTAIALVMLYHLNRLQPTGVASNVLWSIGRAGWSGVDLFFVLSGFLITGLLLDSRGQPGYFRSFYARRALRILPLYYAFLTLIFVIIPLFVSTPGPEYRALLANQGWYWTFLTNVRIAVLQTWDATPLKTGHLWSLAVEEQFYLVWPFIVLWCTRARFLAALVFCLVLAVAIRLAVRLAGVDPVVSYVLMPTRVDGLVIGAFVAFVIRQPGYTEVVRRAARWAALLAGAAILAIVWRRGGPFSQTDPAVQLIGYPALATLFGAALLGTLTLTTQSSVRRLLEQRWLRSLGRYSFALYVVHDPIGLWVETGLFKGRQVPMLATSHLPGQCLFLAIVMGLSFVAAYVSWHLLEKRFLALKRLFPRPGGDIVVGAPLSDRVAAHPLEPAPLRSGSGKP